MAAGPLTRTDVVEDQWKRVRSRLRAELGEAAFRTWLRPLTLDGVSGTKVVLRVPGDNMKKWVMSRCGERLRDLWCGESDEITDIAITVGVPERRPRTREIRPAQRYHGGADRLSRISGDVTGAATQLNPRFTFENFVVGETNHFAHRAAMDVADSSQVSYNPLYLYGSVGLGKTHLMNAIAWRIRTQRPERQGLFMSAEKFMTRFVHALRFKDTMAFKNEFRSVDVLMIDDIQFIADKASTQEEFLHTFNALADLNRQIVITADRAPSNLEGIDERLRSRLNGGVVALLRPADYPLRLDILNNKLVHSIGERRPGIDPDDVVSADVLEFLATAITSNVRELEGALNRIVAHVHMMGEPVTLDSTRDLLRDLLRAQERRVTVEEIQKLVADHYNLRLADMLSSRKERAIARPRQVAMYLVKRLTNRSLPEIGRRFGGRDHTTVMHGVRKIEELKAKDPALAEDVETLEHLLGQPNR